MVIRWISLQSLSHYLSNLTNSPFSSRPLSSDKEVRPDRVVAFQWIPRRLFSVTSAREKWWRRTCRSTSRTRITTSPKTSSSRRWGHVSRRRRAASRPSPPEGLRAKWLRWTTRRGRRPSPVALSAMVGRRVLWRAVSPEPDLKPEVLGLIRLCRLGKVSFLSIHALGIKTFL